MSPSLTRFKQPP